MATYDEKASNGNMTPDSDTERRNSTKKLSVDYAEAQRSLRTVEAGMTPEQVDAIMNVDPKEEARILRKIDFRLVPMLALLYL